MEIFTIFICTVASMTTDKLFGESLSGYQLGVRGRTVHDDLHFRLSLANSLGKN